MSWYLSLFYVFLFGGFGWAADFIHGIQSDHHKRKMAKIKAAGRKRELEAAKNKPPEAICGCTHHLAKHDANGRCHEEVTVPTSWDADKQPIEFQARQCNCQQYVGPEPLGHIFAQELTE